MESDAPNAEYGTHSFLGNVVSWRGILPYTTEVGVLNDYNSQYRRDCSCQEAVETSHEAFRELEFLHWLWFLLFSERCFGHWPQKGWR